MNKRNYEPNAGQPAPDKDAAAAETADAAGEEAAVALTDADRAKEPTEAEALRAEIASLNDRVLRLAAEIENTRRRGEREKADAARYAISSFARDLLNVADAFDRALEAAPDASEPVAPDVLSAFVTGLKMTDKELHAALERHGVRRIFPKGEKFDPNLHQAVAQAPGAAPAGCVLDVAQPGFVIGERVLRAAMVVVSMGPAPGPDSPDPDSSSDADDGPDEQGSRLDTSV